MEHLVSSSLLLGPAMWRHNGPRLAAAAAGGSSVGFPSSSSISPALLRPPPCPDMQRVSESGVRTMRTSARSISAGVPRVQRSPLRPTSIGSPRPPARRSVFWPRAPALAAAFFTSSQACATAADAGAPSARSGRSAIQDLLPSASAALSSSPPAGSRAGTLAALEARYKPRSDDPSATFLGPSSAASLAPTHTPLYKPVTATSAASLIAQWRALAKSRLTFLMVLTTMAGYALVPASLAAASTSVTTLLALTAGTSLCSASANAMNQFLEAPYDAQMQRTRARPLPARQVTHLHAFGFSLAAGAGGTALLAAAVNPLTAALGAANVVLYAGVYTPLKRLSLANTWVGAVVGAIPPLMGWAASTGSLLAPTDAPAWILAGVLFAWQFPHFNSLAHFVRADYAKGGYRMMSVLRPALNRRTSLRYALALFPLCAALPFCMAGAGSAETGAVLPAYALLSAVPNAALLRAAWRFYRDTSGPAAEASARKCFYVSLWHLPAVMLLAMACKPDLWRALRRSIFGAEQDQPHGAAGSPRASTVVE